MCWTCTFSPRCPTVIVRTYRGALTQSHLWIAFGKLWKACGAIQCPQRLPGHVSKPLPTSSHILPYVDCATYLPCTHYRSFILAFRIMKLIIQEQGNNAWLAHGTPHLHVRNDYMDTETGIKRKQVIETAEF